MNIRAYGLCPVVLLSLFLSVIGAPSAELLVKKTGTGTIIGYKDTPMLPGTGGKYHIHDPDRPAPKPVTPGRPSAEKRAGSAPSDAIVLFDGDDLAAWRPSSWKVQDGYVEIGPGSLETKQPFGDCQVHVEWMSPTVVADHLMSRGNSGVLLMGRYEIQIFDSFPGHADHIYPDGQAASLYGQTPPLVNACRRPGEWQSFDIVFTAPEFKDGKVSRRGVVTMFHNGVLVHLNEAIAGPMAHREIAPYEAHAAKLPLVLQGHGSPVRFRNIWIRPLD